MGVFVCELCMLQGVGDALNRRRHAVPVQRLRGGFELGTVMTSPYPLSIPRVLSVREDLSFLRRLIKTNLPGNHSGQRHAPPPPPVCLRWLCL